MPGVQKTPRDVTPDVPGSANYDYMHGPENRWKRCSGQRDQLLTDPSYTGQIVTVTYPHVGNCGCDNAWSEAGDRTSEREVSPSGLICRSLYTGPVPDGRVTLSEYLQTHSTPGITNTAWTRYSRIALILGAPVQPGIAMRRNQWDNRVFTVAVEEEVYGKG